MNCNCNQSIFNHSIPRDAKSTKSIPFDGDLKKKDIEDWGFDEKDIYLYLMNRKISRITDRFIFDSFFQLKELSLQGNYIETLDPTWFLNMNNLIVLDLSYNSITSIPNFCFKGLVKLENLKINNNKLKEIGRHSLTGLESLKFLNARCNKITNVHAKLFVELKNFIIDPDWENEGFKASLKVFDDNPVKFFTLKRIICPYS